jgi:hypothetical protein
MNANSKYKRLVKEISNSKDKNIYPKTFELDFQEFKAIIDEIENDGLFEKGWWALDKSYIFNSLTFKGRGFLDNDDKKEYHKIEKTEINNYHNISVGGHNNGNIITGNNNTVTSEFDKNLDELIQAINSSNLQSKELMIQELKNKRNDETSFKSYLISLLQLGVEVTISTLIGKML